MKKLLSLMLCIVFVCLSLVSCVEDIIGEYLPNYKNNQVTDDQIEHLNLYIITGENTSEQAKITVPQNINAYIKEIYRISLNIKYYTVSEYNEAVSSAIANTNEAERPDIILINSENMYNELREEDRLVALNDFYKSRDFRSINTIIDDVLLAASAEVNPTTGSLTYYTAPNNHVIGDYEYIVIDKHIARDVLHFSNSEIEAMTTPESLTELKAAIELYYDSDECTTELSKEDYVNSCVRIVRGLYNDKFLLEYGLDANDNLESVTENSVKKNFVNVSSYPIATKAEAYLSAFAIVKQLDDKGNHTEEQAAILNAHYSKCMSIIYALNTDVQLKNMLQYGYVGTNYKFETNEKHQNTNYIVWFNDPEKYSPEVIYEMDMIHTGNMFLNYYCNDINWNEKIHNDILRQNAEAKLP